MIYQSDLIKDYYKSGEVADIIGVHTRTIHNYCKKGILDEVMTDTHRRLIPRDSLIKYLDSKGMIYNNERMDAMYIRIPSDNENAKLNLESQKARIYEKLAFNESKPIHYYEDIGSGLDEQRIGLKSLITSIMDKRIERVFILRKEILSRFGFKYLKMICDLNHTDIIILEDSNHDDELESDIIQVVKQLTQSLDKQGKERVKNEINQLL